MKSQTQPFRFKRFEVRHAQSTIKVGADGMLLGATGRVEGDRGLDIGCGCGLIALMAAQRNERAWIDAIDIHSPSVEEASFNFNNSPWKERLRAIEGDVLEYAEDTRNQEIYDFILSNPPFFNSGIKAPATAREMARHEGELTVQKLLEAASKMLKNGGTLSLILPFSRLGEITDSHGLHKKEVCIIADRPGKTPKRAIVTLIKGPTEEILNSTLYLRNENGEYSSDYLRLTSDFHLFSHH